MADTVEQVYVWDGNDWTPVVRDETVSNTSELTNDGEDGVNPFITAADIPDVPDKKLPISSDDDTVVLDSPSANTFTISTGGEQALYLARTTSDADQLVIGENPPGFQGGVGSAGLHIQGVASAEIKSTLNSTGHGAAAGGVISYASNGWVIRDRQSGGGIKFTINPSGDAGTSAFDALGIGGFDGQIRLGNDGSAASPGMTYYNDLDTGISRTADDEISIVTGGTSSLIVSRNDVTIPGELKTPRIVGPADNDASIELGANAKIQTEANNAFVVNPAGSAYGILHTPRGNSSAGQAVRPFLTSVHASHSYDVRMTDWGYLTIDLLSGDPASPYKLSDYQASAFTGKVDRYSGFTVGGFDPVNMQATQAYGAYINVNAALDGREFYAGYCDGTAPSKFGGDIQTPRIVGSAAPDTNASIELGPELLTSNHTPTQPNSIATKQTVDDKIQVMTTAEYNALGANVNSTTLYCLTD